MRYFGERLKTEERERGGRVAQWLGEPDVKSEGPGFKFCPRPRLLIASWFASSQLEFLTCYQLIWIIISRYF